MTNAARYEKSGHGLKVGDSVKMFDGGRWFYGRITGFESFEGSGLVFEDGLVRVSGINWPVAWGALSKTEVSK